MMSDWLAKTSAIYKPLAVAGWSRPYSCTNAIITGLDEKTVKPATNSIGTVAQRGAAKNKNIKRYDIAGRKVIFYVENMKPGQQIAFVFQVKALYPVKAKGVTSTAYSYYRPDIKGETLGTAVTVH